MKKIHRLPQSLVAKIAAGEVIERPAFAVKELIENAIDAGANFIEIQIEESGLRRITVIDNGSGMSKEDLEVCFLPHTTSKLKNDSTLTGIASLGFRGEALSSIAAVSHMTITTRTPKDIGGRIIQIRGGIVEDSSPTGSPIGTNVTAEGLFYSVPARKKFMKSTQTEFRHISEMISQYALSYPHIQIHLKHNKKTVLDLPIAQNMSERIRLILGPTFTEHLMPIHVEEGMITISGFIGKPQVSSKQNQKQFLFINNRAVTDRMVQLAVREAFGTLLPTSHTPVFILHLSLPYEAVDVNVHPRKEKVSFLNAEQLFTTIKLAVTKTLNDNNITFSLAKFSQENSAKKADTTSSAALELKRSVLQPGKQNEALYLKDKPIIQVENTYLISESPSGISVFDQHAVHERILYNQLKKTYEEKKTKAENISLPNPVLIPFSLIELQTFAEYTELFTSLGFLIQQEENILRVERIPSIFNGRNIEKILTEMLSDLIAGDTSGKIDSATERLLRFLACRAAWKAGDRLEIAEMQRLLQALSVTTTNTTCPHGRPTRIEITKKELEKSFQR